MRVTRKMLENRVSRIENRLCRKLHLHIQNQMPGTYYRLESYDESRNISTRLSAREMHEWLDGFERALDELDRKQREPSKLVSVTFKLLEIVTPAVFAEKVHAACVAYYAIREGEKVIRADYQ